MYDLDKGFSVGYRPIGGPELSEEQKKLSDSLVTELGKLPMGGYLLFYDQMEKGCWPAVSEEPEGWEQMSWLEKEGVFYACRRLIESFCGEKMLKRHLMKAAYRISDQQFEDWWECCGRKPEKQTGGFSWLEMMLLLLFSPAGEISPEVAKGLLEVLQRGGGDNPSVSCADSSLYTREP